MKNFLKITFGLLLLFVIVLYLGTVFLLPQIINSKNTINSLQSLILEKTGTKTNIKGLNLKISPALFVFFKIDSLDAKNNNTSVADIKNLAVNCKLLQKRLTLVSADNIFVDGNYLKQFGKNKKKRRRKKINFNQTIFLKFICKN